MSPREPLRIDWPRGSSAWLGDGCDLPEVAVRIAEAAGIATPLGSLSILHDGPTSCHGFANNSSTASLNEAKEKYVTGSHFLRATTPFSSCWRGPAAQPFGGEIGDKGPSPRRSQMPTGRHGLSPQVEARLPKKTTARKPTSSAPDHFPLWSAFRTTLSRVAVVGNGSRPQVRGQTARGVGRQGTYTLRRNR